MARRREKFGTRSPHSNQRVNARGAYVDVDETPNDSPIFGNIVVAATGIFVGLIVFAAYYIYSILP